MFVPPTMLPNSLRVLVDPPKEYPVVRDDAAEIRAAVVRGRHAGAERPTEPCRDAATVTRRTLVRRSSACTD